MAKPTIAHSRKHGKYEAFKFWTPVKPQCISPCALLQQADPGDGGPEEVEARSGPRLPAHLHLRLPQVRHTGHTINNQLTLLIIFDLLFVPFQITLRKLVHFKKGAHANDESSTKVVDFW